MQVNEKYDHATLLVSCNDPNVKTFSEDIKLFTNSKYLPFENKGILYFLFENEEKGYYYINTENEAAKNCAKATLKHS